MLPSRIFCLLVFVAVVWTQQDPPPSLPPSFFMKLKPAVTLWFDSDKQQARADFPIGCYARSWCQTQPMSIFVDCDKLVATSVTNFNESLSLCYHAPEFAVLAFKDQLCPLEKNPLLQLLGLFYGNRDFVDITFEKVLPYGEDGIAEVRHWLLNTTEPLFKNYHYYDTKKGDPVATRTWYYSFYFENMVEPCPSFEPLVANSQCKNLIPVSIYDADEQESWLKNPRFEGKRGLALAHEFFRESSPSQEYRDFD